jgi:hypothetical protein
MAALLRHGRKKRKPPAAPKPGGANTVPELEGRTRFLALANQAALTTAMLPLALAEAAQHLVAGSYVRWPTSIVAVV